MKFVMFIEGHMEKMALPDFIRRWLDEKLEKRVGIKIVRFDGWSELIKDVQKKSHMYLNRDKDVIAVISLLDLYGPTIYPDDKHSVSERYKWAKKDLEDKVGHPKFRQFFAVHETEAWLLSEPSIFPQDIQKSLPGKITTPEKINFNNPPAKLLEKLYREKLKKKYKKTTHGQEFFSKLNPEKAYDKCPYLKLMLDEMLYLAREAEKY